MLLNSSQLFCIYFVWPADDKVGRNMSQEILNSGNNNEVYLWLADWLTDWLTDHLSAVQHCKVEWSASSQFQHDRLTQLTYFAKQKAYGRQRNIEQKSLLYDVSFDSFDSDQFRRVTSPRCTKFFASNQNQYVSTNCSKHPPYCSVVRQSVQWLPVANTTGHSRSLSYKTRFYIIPLKRAK
jgi:hypothetical protein